MARNVGKRDNRYLAKLVTQDRAPCAFCRREVDDEVTYGKLYAIGNIQCHYLCALLSCCLVQKGPEEDGLFGFMYKDILAELERSKKHKCSFCGCGGANLGCSVSSCRKQFHLPCGRERNAVSLFYGSYKSFCQAHAPRQKIPEHIMCKVKLRMKDTKKNALMKSADNSTEDGMVCVICYESVDAYPSVNTFWPPCCARDAWFHRSCLQRMALSAGMHYLKCPLCNDKENFYDAIVSQGYYVPDRDAAWELEQNAFADIYERTLTCAAASCRCPLGPDHDADQGMWDIKLCLLCGSVGAHAHCIGASETTRYVCLTCTPAKPADIQALADTIDKLILQEQASSAARHGPIMPSRMSLRRTKGRSAILNRPSSSGAYNMKTDIESPAQPLNIQSSRQELNLKSPRKLIHTDSYNSPKKCTESYISPEAKRPIKLDQILLEQSLNESYKNMEVISPIKHITDSNKNLEAKILSPMKLLEQSFREKIVCMGGNAILDDRVIDLLRRRFSRPRPLSEKKKIIDDIVNGLFNNLNKNSPLKQKEQLKEWFSPRKCYNITEEEESKEANDNSTKATENTFENKENVMHETPKKSKSSTHSTPNKVHMSRLNADAIKRIENKDKINDETHKTAEITEINDEKHKNAEITEVGDEKHHDNGIREVDNEKQLKNAEIGDIGDEKHHAALKNIDGNDDSNSTFQLPSEFLAESLSDESCITFQSPMRKTIEMKDSSLEISEQDHSVNIDVKTIRDSQSDSPNKKCAFKFSRSDKETLEETDVGIDLESFQRGYLSEVDRYKCCFNHKHDKKKIDKINYRTVIDFAIDAHLHKTTDKSKKRKLSEGSLVLNKNDAKKRKMSENDLNLSPSSDDFEVKKELRSPTKQVVPVQDKVEINDRKRKRKAAKDRKRERKNREWAFKNLIEERSKKNRSNYGNKILIDEKNHLNRKLEANEQHIKERREEIGDKRMKSRSNDVINDKNKEKQMKNKSNDDNHILENEKSSLYRKLEAIEPRDKDRKETKNKSNVDKNRRIDENKLIHKKLKEPRDKDRKQKEVKNPSNDENKKLKHNSNQEKLDKAKQLVAGDKKEKNNDKKLEDKKRIKDGRHVKHKVRSTGEKMIKDTSRVDEANRRKEKYKNTEKHNKNKHSDKHAKDKKHRGSEKYVAKRNDDQNIEVTIDSKSKSKQKTKLSISNSEKDISVKIKWKKKQLRLKIESKKAEKVERHRKFKQYVLQYFSEVTPKEVLVKPEKEVSPLKRKYVKQEKTPDKLKQMSISNFFKVKSPE